MPDRTPAGETGGGILAGQIVDSFERRPPATFIQVVDLQSGKSSAAPIEVAADSQGYFTIQGLRPGKQYQLTARAKNGSQVLAGTVMAIPPNPKLLIRITEDLATGTTPPVPPTTTLPDGKSESQERSQAPAAQNTQPAARIDPAWAPGRVAPNAVVPNETGGREPRWEPSAGDHSRITNIPAQVPQARINPSLDPDSASASVDPAVVPSCVLTGQTLHNFALHDLNGKPWEYRKQRRGRLVLLDFWHSQCYPCLDAIRHLNIWQQDFGAYGLEVIGIAYEEGDSAERVQKVSRVRERLGINYRLLMGGQRDCPVRTQFGILAYPTVVLLDDQGQIIWRSEGLGQDQLREVDIIIRQRLGVR
jgi:thiol-disulfide isomerase/thioredoxin